MFRFVQRVLGSIAGLVRAVFRPRPDEIKARVYWDDSVAMTLQNLVLQTETRASGRVQIITLADFRNSIPDLWDKYKDRILIITETTISRMIGKGNTFIPQGDDAWLMLFTAASDEEAQARTDAIAAKIGEKLMGARFTPEPLPLPATAKLNLSSALRADGTIDLEAVKAAVGKARRGQIAATLAAPAAAPPKPARPKPAPVVAAPAPEYATSFRLAWSAETQSIDTFTLRALNDMGVNIFADSAPSVSPLAAVALVKIGAGLFRTMCAAGVRAKFCIPIPFSVLETPALGEIQQTINEVNQQARLMQLRIVVARIPASVSLDRLVAMRELFRPFVRDVAFAIDPFSLQDQALALEHVVFVADVSGNDVRGDSEFYHAMLLLRQCSSGRVVHITGLQSHKQLTSAVNAGIDEVSGPAVHEDLKVLPQNVMVVRRQDLLLP